MAYHTLFHRSLSASLMCAALLGPAHAQAPAPAPPTAPPPPPTVQLAPTPPSIPEKVPFDIPYGPPIGLDRAKPLVAAAEAEATKRGWKMNIAVVDPHGDLVAFERMDDAQLPSIAIAENKAHTAARWRRDTRVFFRAFDAGKSGYGVLDPQMAPAPGGLPIIADGKVIGGFGVSGGTGDQDEIVCKAGLAALK